MIEFRPNSFIHAMLLLAAVGSSATWSALACASHPADPVSKTLGRYQCAACHGDRGESSRGNFPSIAGQKSAYLVEALKQFRDRRRVDPIMSPVVAHISDEEITAVSRHYSQIEPTLQRQSPPLSEHSIQLAINGCGICHGTNGISIRPDWPNLAGQQREYLLSQFDRFRRGQRDNSLMSTVTHMIAPDELPRVVDYFATLPPCRLSPGQQPDCHLANSDAGPAIMEAGNGIYVYSNSGYFPVFVVTAAGIIVFDPISVDAAVDLRQRLRAFKVPVRYVVLTHGHPDHSTGAEVFRGEAQIVSSLKTKTEIEARRKREMAVAKAIGRVARLDPLPDITFEDHLTLSLGGKTLELKAIRPYSHSDGDMIVGRLVEDRFLIAVDGPTPHPITFMDFRINPILQLLDDTKNIEKLEFDWMASGHDPAAPKAALASSERYLEYLISEVKRAISAGKPVEAAVDQIRLPDEMKRQAAEALFPPNTPADIVDRAIESAFQFNVEGAYKQLKDYAAGQPVEDIHIRLEKLEH